MTDEPIITPEQEQPDMPSNYSGDDIKTLD